VVRTGREPFVIGGASQLSDLFPRHLLEFLAQRQAVVGYVPDAIVPRLVDRNHRLAVRCGPPALVELLDLFRGGSSQDARFGNAQVPAVPPVRCGIRTQQSFSLRPQKQWESTTSVAQPRFLSQTATIPDADAIRSHGDNGRPIGGADNLFD